MTTGEKILLVDESPEAVTLKAVLAAEGYQVEACAFRFDAERKIEQATPTMVLMGLGNPRLDAVEFCRDLKSDSATDNIKVMMVVPSEERSSIGPALAAGCDDYVMRPVDRTDLLVRMEELVRFARLRTILRQGVV